MHVSKIDWVKENVSKVDQQCISTAAADRFLKRTSSFDRFSKQVFLLDRLLIRGIGIEGTRGKASVTSDFSYSFSASLILWRKFFWWFLFSWKSNLYNQHYMTVLSIIAKLAVRCRYCWVSSNKNRILNQRLVRIMYWALLFTWRCLHSWGKHTLSWWKAGQAEHNAS